MTTAFRPLDPFMAYTDLNGNLAAGGNLTFYAAGTTTAQDVFGDEALTVNNGNVIAIGTDGRAVDDIWCNGTLAYRCRVYAADGTLIIDRDNLALPGSGSLTIPALASGDFLTNNGTSLLWAAIRQALDPAGATNKVMGSDGANLVWVPAPTNGTPGTPGTNANITLGANSIKMNNGTGNFWLVQWGSATAPASGIPSTSQSITFPTAFMAAPNFVKVTVTGNSFANNGKLAVDAVTVKSATGFTVGFDTNTTTDNIFGSVPFDWIAFGTVAT